jgi:pyruvate,orthophosphate dikinase
MLDIYTVGLGDTKSSTPNILGGKGFGLVQMNNLGINVPPAIIIPTNYCMQVIAKSLSVLAILSDVYPLLSEMEAKFGYAPLLSIRSGAKDSMPGMLNTILNIGLNSSNLSEWSARIGERTTYDSYRRLIQMFGDVVFNIPSQEYENILTSARNTENVLTDADLSIVALKEVVVDFLKITPNFPQTLKMQLRKAVGAVFNSWNTDRAITYRKIHNISNTGGTAVIIQAMVFGNMNDNSCTGVLFTRSPSTGENKLYGEYLVNAQGEDVVAGIRTPNPLEQLYQWNPEILTSLIKVAYLLEHTNKDMQDIEFTVQNGELFILQTRKAKRTALAALTVAKDLVNDGVISKEQALNRVSYAQYCTAQTPILDPSFNISPNSVGIPASTGFATGVAVFSSAKALELSNISPVVLLTKETTPEDIAGMNASVGILTMTGGSSSHAAVIARGMDKVCVVGCLSLKPHGVSLVGVVTTWELNGIPIIEGVTKITLEGATGKIWLNTEVPVISAKDSSLITTYDSWVSEVYPYIEKGVATSGFVSTSSLTENGEITFSEVAATFKGIMSLDSRGYNIPDYDKGLFELVSAFDPIKDIGDTVTKLVSMGGNDTRIVVRNDYSTYIPALENAGYKIIPEIEKLDDLILAQGLVVLHPNVSMESAVIKKVMSLKDQCGESIKPLIIANKAEDITINTGVLVATKQVMMAYALA